MSRNRTRRSLLAAVTAGGASLAGCTGSGDDATAFSDHASSQDIDGVPRLGPPPSAADAVIVEFADPSCETCATFAAETFPTLRSDLIRSGRVAYYWRARPIVEPWGQIAARALIATHDRDPDAFWWLKERFYERQATIDTADDVLAFTADALADYDTVTADAVIDDVQSGADNKSFKADERAATASDVSSVPSFVLFRDGAYVTTVVGPHNAEVFKGALDIK